MMLKKIIILGTVILILSFSGCKNNILSDIEYSETNISIEYISNIQTDKSDETEMESTEKSNIVIPNESETIKINIDGFDWDLYLYESVPQEDFLTLNPVFKYYPVAVLTNAVTNSIPPVLVREGDTFLNWKVKEIKSHYGRNYICFDDGRMYYSGDTTVQFEGEVKVTAKVYYGYIEESAGMDSEEYLYIKPDKEYCELFPEIVYE